MRPPRFEARTRVLHDVKLSLDARAVYLDLDDRAMMEGWVRKTRYELATCLGIPLRTWQRYLAELVSAGYVSIEATRISTYILAWSSGPPVAHVSEPLRATSGLRGGPTVAHVSSDIKSLGTQVLQVVRTPGGIAEPTPEETRVAGALRDYPGAQRLPAGPDAQIVRACLAAHEDPEEVCRELRRMGLARLEPGWSWGWFPKVLARRLAGKPSRQEGRPERPVWSPEEELESISWLAENDPDLEIREVYRQELAARRRVAS